MSALHLLFRVGEAEYVVPARDVLQVEAFEGLTPVPGSPPHVAGLMQVRGRVIPVVDLRRRFGLPGGEQGAEARVIVVQVGSRTVGLLADRAREVVQVDAAALAAPPEVVAQEGAGFVRSVTRLGERLVMQVDLARVVGEEQG